MSSRTTKAIALHEHIFSQPAETFANKPWALMNAMEAFATQIGGMMIFRSSKLKIVQTAMQQMDPKPKTVLEFGTYVGHSALAWGAILQDLQDPSTLPECNVYTFELDPEHARITRDFIKLAGLQDTVHVVEGPAAESVKTLYEQGKITQGAVDMAFIDHWEEYYLPDLKLCESLHLFRRGTIVVADNTDHPGAPDYVAHVKAGGDGTVKYESVSHSTGRSSRPGGPVRASFIVLLVYLL
ncbi:hypothetical protein ASPZODRAFT_97944 [Penicilliopsis zonata CBS 506.65]|uniref:catechol O-methyltransferase n=1 Tax=Penicilliopsis zonata CBS 506.65 TaxID=1073090 RepID=A0A1L9SGE9_9EURO|nr:hypothetical protein ASPZODRAFT_97944 [Penicilliopsis zonata CBS 506.65]OJJ46236.1 hypothetical protein ASPZODRAFT_97944 [Penicilliopsis zonata CBS 506.65]